jgi:hypothetical protein
LPAAGTTPTAGAARSRPHSHRVSPAVVLSLSVYHLALKTLARSRPRPPRPRYAKAPARGGAPREVSPVAGCARRGHAREVGGAIPGCGASRSWRRREGCEGAHAAQTTELASVVVPPLASDSSSKETYSLKETTSASSSASKLRRGIVHWIGFWRLSSAAAAQDSHLTVRPCRVSRTHLEYTPYDERLLRGGPDGGGGGTVRARSHSTQR